MSDPSADARIWERLSLRGWLLLGGAIALAAAGWASYHRPAPTAKATRENPFPALPTRPSLRRNCPRPRPTARATPVAGYRRDVGDGPDPFKT